jgi:DNA-binding response OmpR family regulator
MSSLALARILIVDDEIDLVTALCRVPDAQGYSMTGAATAAPGLDALRAGAC